MSDETTAVKIPPPAEVLRRLHLLALEQRVLRQQLRVSLEEERRQERRAGGTADANRR